MRGTEQRAAGREEEQRAFWLGANSVRMFLESLRTGLECLRTGCQIMMFCVYKMEHIDV